MVDFVSFDFCDTLFIAFDIALVNASCATGFKPLLKFKETSYETKYVEYRLYYIVYFSSSLKFFELYIAERVIVTFFGLMLLFCSPDDGLGPQASLYRELWFIVYAMILYKKQTKN